MTRQNNALFENTIFEDLFSNDFMRGAFADLDRAWEHEKTKLCFPPHNVSTTKDGVLVLELALAGYEPSQISIQAEDQHIVVEGKVKSEDDSVCFTLWKGIKGSNFKVRFPIPTKFDMACAVAEFKNGMMLIKVPLAEERRPRKIDIATM